MIRIFQYVFLIILLYLRTRGIEGNVHQCVHSSRKLAKYGSGETVGACMECNPTNEYCPIGCQPLVDKLFLRCQGICLPDGYFFDPEWKYDGCWSDHYEEIKIQVERCGCNSALSVSSSFILTIFGVLLLSLYFLV